MKKKYMLILFFAGLTLNAQNLDSLYSKYVNIRTGNSFNPKAGIILSGDENSQKCTFGMANQIKRNINVFNAGQKTVLQKLLYRPSTDTSIVSPHGYFRIHFMKSDFPDYVPEEVRKELSPEQLSNYKKLYLDSLAIAADSVYNYEVNILEYPAPPLDGMEGGDDKYDIYIEDIGNAYGETVGDENIGRFLYTSYTRIDKSFANTKTKRIDGARVTIAHEFHHAIQMGNYGLKTGDAGNLLDVFYHEITSTSMEEFVYDNINDYYGYLPYYMRNSARSFVAMDAWYTGYDLAIWNIFIASQFDLNIIKRTWELMKQSRAMNAIDDAVSERGSSFEEQFAQFGLWLYFTNHRSLSDKYFEEAANYPLLKPTMSLTFNKPESSLEHYSFPLSVNVLLFTDNKGSQIDTFVAIVNNCDISGSMDNPTANDYFRYRLSSQSSSGFNKILDGYYSVIESSGSFVFTETNIFNNSPVNNGQVTGKEIDYPFPQPFTYSQSGFIYFPAGLGKTGNADLNVYSIDMNLIYSGSRRILNLDKVVVQWDCIDNSGKKLGSGVYFYVIKSGDEIKKGKFVIIND